MKRVVYMILALALIGSLAIPLVVMAGSENSPDEFPLYAGQTTLVGKVQVWNDTDNVTVKYVLTEPGWALAETHLDIQNSLTGLQTNKAGNPVVGKFLFIEAFDRMTGVTQATYTRSWAELGSTCSSPLYIAAHAVVVKIMDGIIVQQETAWGGDISFPDATNWSKYIIYTPDCTVEFIEGGIVTVAFEDGAITNSDWDYNDWVADIDTELLMQGGNLKQVDFTVIPEARGAGYQHVFHLQIPAGTFGGDGIYLLTNNGVTVSTGTFNHAVVNDFIVIPNTYNALPGYLTNTVESQPYVHTTVTAKLNITFNVPYNSFDLSAYNPYAPSSMVRVCSSIPTYM